MHPGMPTVIVATLVALASGLLALGFLVVSWAVR